METAMRVFDENGKFVGYVNGGGGDDSGGCCCGCIVLILVIWLIVTFLRGCASWYYLPF